MDPKRDGKKLERWVQSIQRAARNGKSLDVNEALIQAGIGTSTLGTELSRNENSGGSMTPEQFVDWLLSEIEYCSHTLLMASGQILVHVYDRQSAGALIMGYLWAQSGHRSLLEMEDPVACAQNRFNNAIKALQLMLECRPNHPRHAEAKRWKRILAMTPAPVRDDMKVLSTLMGTDDEYNYGRLEVKPFHEAMANETTRRELYLYGYVEAMRQLLEKMTGIRWNLELFGDGQKKLKEVLSIVDNIPAVRSRPKQNISEFYFRLFRVSFDRLNFSKKLRVMMYVFEKYGAVMWHLNDEQFEPDLMALAAKLIENPAITDLAFEASWFFMISLKYTWWRLMLVASRQPAIIPALIKVLHKLYPVTSLRSRDNGPRDFLQCGLRLLTGSQILDDENESNLVKLLGSLVIYRKRATPDNFTSPFFSITPVVHTTEGILSLVIPALKFNPRFAMNLLLDILANSEECMRWSGDEPTEGQDGFGEKAINIVELTSMIVDAIVNSKTEEVKKLGLETLHLLATFWKRDPSLEISLSAVHWLQQRLDNVPWLIRWFAYRNLRHWIWVQEPLPRCLVDMFVLPDWGFKGVDCDHGPEDGECGIQCGFTVLLQIGRFSVELALELLVQAKFDSLIVKMHSGGLTEPLTRALVQVLNDSDRLEDWRNCMDLLTSFFNRLWSEQDAFFKDLFDLESVSIGTRVAAPAVKLCEAMEAMLLKSWGQNGSGYVHKFSVIITDLVREQVQSMDNPLAKVFACILLHICVNHVLTKAKECVVADADMDMLAALVKSLEDEKVKNQANTSIALSEILGSRVGLCWM